MPEESHYPETDQHEGRRARQRPADQAYRVVPEKEDWSEALLQLSQLGHATLGNRLFAAKVGDQCQYEKDQPNQNGDGSYDLGEVHPPIYGLVPNPCFQLSLGDNALILQRALLLEFLFRLFAGKNHHIHRKTAWAEVRVDKVNGEDKQDREQRFLAVDHKHSVQRPAGQKSREERRKPHRVARESNDDHAPEHRPVIELLPVCVAIELRLRSQPHEPAKMSDQVLDILPVRHHRGGSPEDSFLLVDHHPGYKVLQVVEKRKRQDDRAKFMQEKDGAEATHRACKKTRRCVVAEAHRQTRRRQSQKRCEQDRMKVSLRQREAHIVTLVDLALRLLCGLCPCLVSHGSRPLSAWSCPVPSLPE